MRQNQRRFFLIIGLTALFILAATLLNRYLIQPALQPVQEATATAQVFFATQQAASADAITYWQGIPVSTANLTASGLQIEIVRVDDDAWPLVHLENQFNKEPPPDKRMIMLTLKVSNVADEDEPYVSGSQFKLIDEQRRPYDTFHEDSRCGVVPQELGGRISRGESLTGNICMVVPRSSQTFVLRVDSFLAGETVHFSVPTPTP